MIRLKSEKEILIMKEGGRRLRLIVEQLKKKIQPGITTLTIDQEAERLIKQYKGEPSFKKVRDYFFSTCLPINEQIVHTPPSERVIKEGDIFTLDIGFFYQGYHTDFADTWIIGEKSDEKIRKFLNVGKRALYKAIEQAKVGNYLGQISQTIQKEIEENGYFVIKELTGHGIGKKLHEDPYVFGYLDVPVEKTIKIKPGLTLAIEVIYSMGTGNMKREKNNNWSIITEDRSLAACFEHTIAVLENKTLILT
jgi:methionyl aminopeptidase